MGNGAISSRGGGLTRPLDPVSEHKHRSAATSLSNSPGSTGQQDQILQSVTQAGRGLWEEGWRRVPGLGRAPPPAKHRSTAAAERQKSSFTSEAERVDATRAILPKKPKAPAADNNKNTRAQWRRRHTRRDNTSPWFLCLPPAIHHSVSTNTLTTEACPAENPCSPPPGGNFQLLVKRPVPAGRLCTHRRSLTWSQRAGEEMTGGTALTKGKV